jgi:hypothetical protein
MGKENKNENSKKKLRVEDKEGLTVSYKKEELLEHFPHLVEEVSEKKTKSIKIDMINNQIEKIHKEKAQKVISNYPNELYNPGAIDFIRRCSEKEEAIIILDYLMNRNEISEENYKTYKNMILQEGGLERLIKESGGQKQPGYYLRKYYKKYTKNQKLNSKED